MENCKVLHLLSTNKFTDIENTILQSIELLKEVCTFAYASPSGQISKILRKNEINYLPLENMDFKSISSVIESYAPNIIHAHGLNACILASKFSKKIKIIAHIHEDIEAFHKFSKESFKFNSISKCFEKIIWPSEESLNNYKYKKNIIEKSIILRKAINCENVIKKSTSCEKDAIEIFDIILFAESITNDEFTKIINILGLLKGRGFTFKCGVFSSIHLSETFSSYINECDLSDSIFFINNSDEYHSILSKSKILFIAENHEEIPIYALEANALGVPILSLFSNGLKKIVQNEFNGFLANNEFDLANFAARMLDDKHLWLLLSTNSLTNSDNQNKFEDYIEQLKILYHI